MSAGGDLAIHIPFNRSSTVGKELEYIAESLRIGQIAGNQAFGRRCERLLEEVTGARRVLLTSSCTHALEMSAYLLDLRPGDEVLVPAFTFVSTANAFVARGARPVFVDVRADTLNLDERLLEERIGPRSRAVVPVHYGGVACEMDPILDVARRHGLVVVEDNAHGLFGRYRGRALGTLGDLATLSFHETKNLTSGEGGALLINAERWIERAEVVREKGTNRVRFSRGEVDRYTWVDRGSSYVMSDVLAAFLYGQLEQWRRIQERRREIWTAYDAGLADWAGSCGVRRPVIPAHCEQAFHLYYLLLPSREAREGLIAHLRARGILAVFHYLPLNVSPVGRELGGLPGECPVSEEVSERLVRLPFFNTLTHEEQAEVIGAVVAFRP
jgi:dTDP-4-amino-4,6-dideoxygalactose transaminase